ncbi:hypothetical protein U1Q18_050687 [Sarracenia purpurea var. burkii]
MIIFIVQMNPKKPVRYANHFKKSWKANPSFEEWLNSSVKGPNFAYCSLCAKDVSIANSSINDLYKHRQCKKHGNAELAKNFQTAVSETAYMNRVVTVNEKVRTAELRLSAFLASKNVAINAVDELTDACKAAFSDSLIAKEMSLCRSRALISLVLKVYV